MKDHRHHGWLARIFSISTSSTETSSNEAISGNQETATEGRLNDEPGRFDLLGRGTQILALLDTISRADPPLVIGVHGDWGSGKTSFLRVLQCLLNKKGRKEYNDLEKQLLPEAPGHWIAERASTYLDKEQGQDIPTVWFNPWEYQFEDEPIIPLLDTIRHQQRSGWDKLSSRLKQVVENPALRIIAKSALGVAQMVGPGWLTALTKDVEEKAQSVLDSMSQFRDDFEACMRQLTEQMGTDRLVIFIDDLDRCEAAYVVKILEALKLHLLNRHCIFILGCSKQRVVDALVGKLSISPSAADEYIDKIIQVPIYLPPIWEHNFKAFLKHLGQNHLVPVDDGEAGHEPQQRCFDLLTAMAESNPRRLKRFLFWYELEKSMINAVASPDGTRRLSELASTFVEDESLLLKIKLLQFLRPAQFVRAERFLQDKAEPAEAKGWSTGERGATELHRSEGGAMGMATSTSAELPMEKRYRRVLSLPPNIGDEISRRSGDSEAAYIDLMNELVCLLQLTTEIREATRLEEAKAAETHEALVVESPQIIERRIREKLSKPEGPLTQEDYDNITELDFLSDSIAELSALKPLSKLTSLSLIECTELSDLSPLEGLQGLESLYLSNTRVTDSSLRYLKRLIELKRLFLDRTMITDKGMKHLENLANLETLWLDHTQVMGTGLIHLAGLHGLKDLALGNTHATDAGLEHLEGLSGLKTLYLYDTLVTDAGLEHLKGLSGLEILSLGGNQITGAGLKHLEGLSNLKSLSLSSSQIDDSGLAHLSGLNELVELDLSDTRVSDAGLAYLERLIGLRKLFLSETEVTDKGLKSLEYLISLDTLSLADTMVTDDGLRHLMGHYGLHSLYLQGTQVGDTGLTYLEGLENLRTLSLADTKVTEDGVKKLNSVLPDVVIVVRI